ncbi:DUF2281 domain-containing protein [Leptolyngbya sp. BC1307]|uniref:DUF2281 domain-containing protein n=1 Tax=Leptolyngbya sp. BC1307 TaxID=2029589 RepID=UPI001980437F|nr:DUF2281 domain-containing protein [Leptolyngbya sp. BC1307]
MRSDQERMRDIQESTDTHRTTMLTLETAIQKIQQLPLEQRNKVIEFIEFLEFQSNQRQKENLAQEDQSTQEFFELAGIWKDRDITTDSIRSQAWGENRQ